MNQKIVNELVTRVGTDCSGKWISVDNIEKLSELIVQECVKVCDRVYFDDYPDAEDFERSQEGDAIKQHFGIKS